MISFLLMFWNHVRPDKDKPITILRVPQVKSLRALQLGLTLALIFASLSIMTHEFSQDTVWINLAGKIIFLALLFILARLGGWFVFLMMVLYSGFALWVFPHNDSLSESGFSHFIRAFGNGFLFGAIMATIYNELMYFHTRIFRRKLIKRSFTFHPASKFDIIKSPIKDEVIADTGKNPYKPVCDYKLKKGTIPDFPYTIAFIANPCIQVAPHENTEAMPDPIMYNREIFFNCVDKALASFESNEVLGRPEIWSRIRIVIFYDELLAGTKNPKNSFVKTFGEEIFQDNQKSEYLLYPQTDMRKRLLDLAGDPKTKTINGFDIREIDVIFALSAHPDHIRSTARYSIYEFPKNRPALPIPNLGFILRPPILLDKLKHIPLPILDFSVPDEKKDKKPQPQDDDDTFYWLSSFFLNFGNFLSPVAKLLQQTSFYPPIEEEEGKQRKDIYYPEEYADYPGLVALNVIGASSKTYIHEFAHAMSATGTGIIVDEFYDQIETNDEAEVLSPVNEGDYAPAFYVNRLERKEYVSNDDINETFFKNTKFPKDKLFVPPIPKEFRIYNDQTYNTDLNHPSAEENWLGFFPERPELADGCIMDRTYGSYAFDKLLQKFIYDRLLVKINRKAPKHDAT